MSTEVGRGIQAECSLLWKYPTWARSILLPPLGLGLAWSPRWAWAAPDRNLPPLWPTWHSTQEGQKAKGSGQGTTMRDSKIRISLTSFRKQSSSNLTEAEKTQVVSQWDTGWVPTVTDLAGGQGYPLLNKHWGTPVSIQNLLLLRPWSLTRYQWSSMVWLSHTKFLFHFLEPVLFPEKTSPMF